MHRFARCLRAFLVARSRLAEDALGEAVGPQRAPIRSALGAGLDTFAYRNPHAASGLRVFEADYPATQEWKRSLISAAHLKPPGSLVYVPVDFERQQLAERLTANGFRADEPAFFFSWLGVTMYLTREAIAQTLRFVAQSSVARSGIVFDYLTAPPRWGLLRRWGLKLVMNRRRGSGRTVADLV